jgi:hypothetical protein
LIAAVRGISTRIASSEVRMVAPRRRPEMRPTSPKIEPVWMGTFAFGPTSTSTEPEAMAKSESPEALRSKTLLPAGQLRTSLSSMNSRSCSGERSRKMATFARRNSSHSSTGRRPGRPSNLAARIGSSAGFRLRLPAMYSATS